MEGRISTMSLSYTFGRTKILEKISAKLFPKLRTFFFFQTSNCAVLKNVICSKYVRIKFMISLLEYYWIGKSGTKATGEIRTSDTRFHFQGIFRWT